MEPTSGVATTVTVFEDDSILAMLKGNLLSDFGPTLREIRIPSTTLDYIPPTGGVHRATGLLSDNTVVEIFCKFAMNDKARTDGVTNEAHLYNGRLKNLQGTVIPKFYGLFKGDVKQWRVSQAICLVMSDCGDPADGLYDAKFGLLYQVVHGLQQIHACGICHADTVTSRNVVIRDNRPTIINFADVFEEHECKINGQVDFNRKRPERNELGCTNIEQFCAHSKVWEYSSSTLSTHHVKKEVLRDNSREKLIDMYTALLGESAAYHVDLALKQYEDYEATRSERV